MATATAQQIHVRVPKTEDFGDDFLPAPDLDAVYTRLIIDYPETHGHLPMVDVKVVWKARGGKKNGK